MREVQTIQVPPQLYDDLAVLGTRAAVLSVRGKRALLSGCAAGALGLAAVAVAVMVGPSTSLSSIHIPAEVLALFSDAVANTTLSPGAGVHSAFTTVGQDLVGIMKSLGGVVMAVGLLFAGYRLIAQADMAAAMSVGIASVIVGAGPVLIGTLLDGGEQTAPPESERQKLIAVADSADYRSLDAALSKVPDPLRSYVLAQTRAVAVFTEEARKTLPPIKDQVLKVVAAAEGANAPGFDRQVLYALETRALGRATSKQALEYVAGREEKAYRAGRVANLAGAVSLVCLAVAACMLSLSAMLKRRIGRVRELIAEPPAGDSQNPLEEALRLQVKMKEVNQVLRKESSTGAQLHALAKLGYDATEAKQLVEHNGYRAKDMLLNDRKIKSLRDDTDSSSPGRQTDDVLQRGWSPGAGLATVAAVTSVASILQHSMVDEQPTSSDDALRRGADATDPPSPPSYETDISDASASDGGDGGGD